MMDPYCKGCAYRQKFDALDTNCGYCIITGIPRGCSAGGGCPHKVKKLPNRYAQKSRCDRLLKGCPV